MLLKQPDARLKAFVIWVPKLSGQEKDVPVATRFVPDDRAVHYWDGNGAAMRAYTTALTLPEDAWDVYMIYGPAARWSDAVPPRPDFWMHQLGSRDHPRVNGPFLDPLVFAQRANEMLGRK